MSKRQNKKEIIIETDNNNNNNNKIDDEIEMTIEEIRQEQDNELNKYNCNREFIFDKSYEITVYLFNFIYKVLTFILRVSGVYLFWIFLHYVASHLYVTFCVPKTIIGFIMSPFMTATPHCQGLRWIVYNAANMINNMWIILGSWACSTILIIDRNNANEAS